MYPSGDCVLYVPFPKSFKTELSSFLNLLTASLDETVKPC